MPVLDQDVVAESAAWELATYLDRDQVLVGGAAYDAARSVWNGAVDNRPAVIVRPWTGRDVQAAIRTARERQLPLSVRGGGYDWAGRSVRPGGMLIDLSRICGVHVDPETRVATIGGGATVAGVMAATSAHGLAAALGATGGVGVAGLTMSGGYGPLTGNFGLALDNLAGADVILEDGRLVRTDATHEPELFWALRGGGGNFGVVTALRIRLHPLAEVMSGLMLFPWREAPDVWRSLDFMLAAAPRELTVQSGVLSGRDGGPILYVLPTWSGDPAHGEKVLGELRRMGRPLASQVVPMRPSGTLSLPSAASPPGRHHAIRTRNVPALSPDVILALVRSGGARTSPLSGITIRHFHGRPTLVPEAATAFAERREHYLVEITASWQPDDPDAALHRAWADSLATALVPSALSGANPGLLADDDTYQITHAYGSNAGRLLAAKKKYDPDGVFNATPLPVPHHNRSWITA
ncbi:MAG TPA: FAD-binding oxidoreductase [Trebonia sp.]|nr:FAD-binding oxidoreductase [Trebonia sp.]